MTKKRYKLKDLSHAIKAKRNGIDPITFWENINNQRENKINIVFLGADKLVYVPSTCNVIGILDNKEIIDLSEPYYRKFNSYCLLPIPVKNMTLELEYIPILINFLASLINGRLHYKDTTLVIHCTEGMMRSATLAAVLEDVYPSVFTIRYDCPLINPQHVVNNTLYHTLYRATYKVCRAK